MMTMMTTRTRRIVSVLFVVGRGQHDDDENEKDCQCFVCGGNEDNMMTMMTTRTRSIVSVLFVVGRGQHDDDYDDEQEEHCQC